METLRSRGVAVLEPASGRLTGSDSGPGRLPEPEDIFAAAMALMHGDTDIALPLAGRTVTISAGGTREPLDPVRFLGNRSSGKQGVALAVAARNAGATVRLLAAHMEVPAPPGVETVSVETALQLREAALAAAADSDVVIMSAAVADFRPAEISGTKIKKRDDTADPVITPGPQSGHPAGAGGAPEPAARRAQHQLIVGFAAETGDGQGGVLAYAQAKLQRKGCDLLVVNHVGADKVFGQDTNAVVILSRSGSEPQEAAGTKTEVAAAVIRRIGCELNHVPHRA